MPLLNDYERELFNNLENLRATVLVRPLNLGGVSSIDGGAGGPPGGFIGYLPQTRVAYDTTEAENDGFVNPSGYSLLDNLNHIRYRLLQLETSGVASSGITVEKDNVEVSSNVTVLNIGDNLTATLDFLGHVTLASTASGGDASVEGEKITELLPETSPLITDLIPVVHNPSGEPITNKVTIEDILALVDPLGHIIESSGSPMTQRAYLDFEGLGVTVTDNLANDRTIVTILGPTASDFIHNIDGTLVTTTDVAGFVASKAGTIDKVYLYGFTLGSASSTIVDIHKNGTTIFTTQGNRPTLAYNDADKVAISSTPDITDLVAGDVLTIDIDQVATGASGLTVVVAMSTVGTSPADLTILTGKVFRSTDLSLTDADQVIPFDTELLDTDGIVDIANFPTRLTCQTAGYYHIVGNVSISAHAATAGMHQAYIFKNGTDVLGAQSGHSAIELQGNVSAFDYLEVGDYLELHAYHDEGGTVTCLHFHTFAPTFGMYRIT